MSTDLQTITLSTPGKDIESYLSCVHAIPILAAEQEKELAQKLYENNDLEAARQLVLSHLRFVVHIARSYQGYGLPLADIIQEGNVGLMKAVDRFDPNRGVKVVSFAVHWIKSEIHEYVLKNWKIVKVATTKAQRKLFFNLRNKKKDITWLSDDDVKMISNELDVKEDTVREMEKRMSSHDVSFDPYSADDGEEGNTYSPADYLTNDDSDPMEIVEKEDFARDQINQLQNAISDLDERSQLILKERWLTDDKPTLHELADKYGISAERIRQIEKKAMEKIRSNIN